MTEYKKPDEDTNALGVFNPSDLVSEGVDDSEEPVNAQARHEVDTCVGVDVEQERGDSTQRFSKRPVESQRVVGDPGWQGNAEQQVGEDEICWIEGSGVDLLSVFKNDSEGNGVPKHPKNQDGTVEDRQ